MCLKFRAEVGLETHISQVTGTRNRQVSWCLECCALDEHMWWYVGALRREYREGAERLQEVKSGVLTDGGVCRERILEWNFQGKDEIVHRLWNMSGGCSGKFRV